MCQLIYKYFRDNIKYTIFIIILLFSVMHMTSLFLHEYMQNRIELSYLDKLDDSLAITDLTTAERKSSADNEINGNAGMGCVQYGVIQNDETERSNACWIVNEFYYTHILEDVVTGKGLQYHTGERQVIIYGSEMENRIGDILTLDGVEYTVRGYIPASQPVFSLSTRYPADAVETTLDAAEDLQYLMYPLNGNMYIVNDGSGWKQDSFGIYESVIVDDRQLDKKMIFMKDIKDCLYLKIRWRSRFSVVSILLLAGIGVFALISTTVMQFYQCSASVGTYLLCGMAAWRYHIICAIQWGSVMAGANLMNYIAISYEREAISQPIYTKETWMMMAVFNLLCVCVFVIMDMKQQRNALVEVLNHEFS